MFLREYIAHQLIRTPFEDLSHNLRDLTRIKQRIQHPELKEIYAESDRMNEVISRLVKPSMNCIDIGAHLGSVLSKIVQFSPNGKHIAIEPVPYKYEWLVKKFPEVKIFQKALSDQSGEVDFFLQPYRSGFSGLKIHASGLGKKQVKRLTVNCTKLDDIIPPEVSIGLIKIDVEGAELSALQGGENLINQYHPSIIFECTQSGLGTFSLSPQQIYDFFQKHSYSLFLFKDWLSSGKALDYDRFTEAMRYPFQAFSFLAAVE